MENKKENKENKRKKENNIINKTPHKVTLVNDDGDVIKTFPKSQSPIRLDSETKRVGTLNNIPLSKTSFGGSNLPPKKEGTYYIVSSLVQSSYSEREDFIIPNETVRDDKGRIKGCKSFAVNSSFSISENKLEKFLKNLSPIEENGKWYSKTKVKDFVKKNIKTESYNIGSEYVYRKSELMSGNLSSKNGLKEVQRILKKNDLSDTSSNFFTPVDCRLGISKFSVPSYSLEELRKNISALLNCLRKVEFTNKDNIIYSCLAFDKQELKKLEEDN